MRLVCTGRNLITMGKGQILCDFLAYLILCDGVPTKVWNPYLKFEGASVSLPYNQQFSSVQLRSFENPIKPAGLKGHK